MRTDKIFLISPQRSGTKSFVKFFRDHGFAAAHWPGNEFDLRVGDLLTHLSSYRLWQMLRPIVEHHQVFADFPYPNVYTQAALDYPTARFILLYREPVDWVSSIRRFSGHRDLSYLEKFYYWSAIGRREPRLSGYSDQELILGRELQRWQAAAFLRGRLATFHLTNIDLGQQLAQHFDFPLDHPFGHI